MNHLSTSSSHLHGGNIDQALKQYGIAPTQPVIDFSVNVNPLGPPEIIRRQWPDWVNRIAAYPSQNGKNLKNFYCRRFDLPEDSVLPGNGSIELIYLVPRAFKIKTALIFTPSFHDYQRACETAGACVTKMPLIKNMAADYLFDDSILSIMKRMDAVLLGNPNNPTGSLLKHKTLLNLARQFPQTLFLIDEAFSQFLENPQNFSLMHLPGASQKLPRNIIVSHSLTKFYALPGLRMGAAISHPDTIDRLAGFKEPWTVNALAEKAATALMDCKDYEVRTRQLIHEQRHFLTRAFSRMPGIDLFTAPANFMLARLNDSLDLDAVMRGLLEKGIFIRDCRNFEGLVGNYVRMAVRGKHDNLQLIRAFTDVCGHCNG